MKKFSNIFISAIFILTVSCGYSPLLSSKKNNFLINELILDGDRQINNLILSDLKKYRNNENITKKYKLRISSQYLKSISNKDKKGNPKNYNLKVIIDLVVNDLNSNQISKRIEKDVQLSAQSKKIDENELEKKYKKDLARLISKDIIFLLANY